MGHTSMGHTSMGRTSMGQTSMGRTRMRPRTVTWIAGLEQSQTVVLSRLRNQSPVERSGLSSCAEPLCAYRLTVYRLTERMSG